MSACPERSKQGVPCRWQEGHDGPHSTDPPYGLLSKGVEWTVDHEARDAKRAKRAAKLLRRAATRQTLS